MCTALWCKVHTSILRRVLIIVHSTVMQSAHQHSSACLTYCIQHCDAKCAPAFCGFSHQLEHQKFEIKISAKEIEWNNLNPYIYICIYIYIYFLYVLLPKSFIPINNVNSPINNDTHPLIKLTHPLIKLTHPLIMLTHKIN